MDGSRLAAGSSDGTLVIWNEDGTVDCEDQLHNREIICLKWNKFEKGRHLLLSLSKDQVNYKT
jgi:WD40 repeat protein